MISFPKKICRYLNTGIFSDSFNMTVCRLSWLVIKDKRNRLAEIRSLILFFFSYNDSMIVTKRITFSEQKLFVFLMFCKNCMHVDRIHLFCLSHIDRIIYSFLYFMTNWTLSFSFYYFHFYRGLTSSEFWSVPNSSEVNKQIINVIKNEEKNQYIS